MSDTQQLAQDFSKKAKIAKAQHLAGEAFDLDELKNLSEQIAGLNLAALSSDKEKITFFINIYNGFTNYIIVSRKLRGGLISNFTMFFLPKLKVGGLKFSLDDIEHGVLRLNKKASYKPMRQFSANDARLSCLPQKLDPRIHFALNCGAASCPALAFYSVDKIDSQLQQAEDNFVNQYFRVNDQQKQIEYSKLFAIYKEDFENRFLADPRYKGYRRRSMHYDTSFA